MDLQTKLRLYQKTFQKIKSNRVVSKMVRWNKFTHIHTHILLYIHVNDFECIVVLKKAKLRRLINVRTHTCT